MFVRERLVSLKKRVVYCVFAWAFAVAAYAVEYDNDVQSQLELLPYKYSRLNKLKVSDNDSPWVIHITDYHCQYELQQNISKIIYFIANKNRNIPVPICIEGASGAVSTAFFSSIPHEKTRNEVSNYFLKKGKISGAEFYAITADTNQQLYGVDDPGLYNRSYELYREVHHTAVKLQPQFQIISDFFKNGIQQRLSTQSKTIVMAGKKLYSESNVKRFIVSMEPYWSRLEPTSDFSAIKRYYELERLVSAVDFKKVNELKKKVFERLAAILPADQREKILFNTYVRYQLNEISEPVYLRHLAVLGEEYNILDRDYAELMHVTQLLEEIAGFNHEQLLEQCILMYDTLKNHFLTPVERQFVMFYEQWNIIEEMCVLGLSRNDFVNQQFPDKDARDRLLMYVLSAIGDSNSSDKELLFPVEFYAAFNQLYNDVSSFYQSAIARDSALANNTVSLIQTHKVPIVILVTGGFHTNGMMDIFEKEHLNYAVINPHGLEFTAQSNYKSIMMEYPQGAMQLLYSPQSNRLAPRVLLKNILADPILSQQLMKEAALMAKLLAMTEADTLSGFSMAEVSYDSNAFKKKVTDTLKSFTSEWIYRLRKAMPQHGESPADVRKMENSLLQLVLIEESLLLKDGKSIGLTVFDADTETFVHVDAAETASLNTILNYDSALFPDAPVTFDLEERLGSFTFRFTRTQQPAGIFDTAIESDSVKEAVQTESVGELLQHIEHLKEKVITRPYAIRYRVQLNKALKAVADFLEFAAEQEEKIGSRAQALHLRSSAALYRGNMERAQLLFREYMKYLPENQSNLASQLFVRNAMMHGQKVSEQIEDSDGKPFYDRYGRPIHARLLDDTLQYGSETSDVTQQRLIQRAREFEEMNELYYSRIVARAASNLTDPSRNYRYTQLNLALMLSSGRTGYSSSMLAQGGQSYGAYTNTQLRRNVVGEVIPRVSYLYDAGYTRELVKNKKIFLNEEDALSDVSLPPSRIAAILVNPIHLPDVLGSLSDFPTRNMPILDTEGNLLWENVTIETVARKYEKAYQSHKKDVVVRREISSADYTYVKKVNNPERIVAIGDVQSDYAALSKILQNTGIIDQNGTLIAQSGTVVVINGDFCDKGTGEAMKKTIDLVMNLQKQAEGTGIEIIVTLGNHEVRFLSGKWYSTSEKTLMDFLSIIGFDEKKAVELREALSKNDTAKLGFFISQYPDAMKYIHYLWHLPVIAQVGNHVFVHAGPTPAFNTQLRNVLNEYVGWSTEQAIDFIYSSAIREKGFNGYLFDDGFDSLFTAAPEWTPPHFIQDQSIVDAFLAFFDGASFLGVGHNKALGVLGNKEQFGKITRVGSRNNIIKLDVGVSHAANRNQKTTFAKAYIVDPRQADFIHSVDESNSRASLVLPSECRKSFMDTDVAAIYDLMFGGNNQRVDSPGSAEQDTSVSINEVFDQFYRKVFMIFTPVAGLKEAQFITETNRWLKVGEPLWNKTKERIDPVEDEKVYKVLERYIQYLYDIRAGIIDSELISLSHFKEYVQNMPLETGSAVSTKALHGREVDYKNNAPRVYAGLHQGKSKPFPSEIIGVVKDRLSQIIEQRRRFNAADYMTIEHLLQVNDLLTKREEYRSAFLLFTANDGNPGIFLDKEGDGVLGVGFHYEIYFGAPLAMYLWNMYIKTGDVEYLNKLTAFIVHESFEYINRYRVSPKKDLAELHSEAERLEVVVAGKGNTGSALDDEIDRLINEWFKENTDKEAKVKKQFLAEYGKYLRETGSFQQYKAVFKTLNIPIEGPALNEADMVNRLYMYLADRYPNQLFDALKSLYVNLEDVFIIIDEGAFTQSELFLLAMMLTEKTDSHETVDVAVLGGVFDFLNVTDLPRPKTSSMQQRSISQILRESSI